MLILNKIFSGTSCHVGPENVVPCWTMLDHVPAIFASAMKHGITMNNNCVRTFCLPNPWWSWWSDELWSQMSQGSILISRTETSSFTWVVRGLWRPMLCTDKWVKQV